MLSLFLCMNFSACSGSDDDNTGGENVKYGNGMDGSTLYVKLSTAGTLSSYITDENMYKITRLKISGEINSTDIWLLRQMAGSDENANSTNGVLGYLDMSDAKVVAGGRPYYVKGYGSTYSTKRDELSEKAFCYCNSLVSVKLPQVTFVGYHVFGYCDGLVSVEFPKSLTKVDDVFYYNSCLESIIFRNPTPPTGSLLDSGRYDTLTLYVPKGSYQAYETLFNYYNNKYNIVELDK